MKRWNLVWLLRGAVLGGGIAAVKGQLPQKPPFRIVHLGDSFSAGNGAGNYNSVSGCFRSQTNWGSQFARSLTDVFAVTYINRACSGGVLSDITGERELGDVFNVFGGCPDPEFPDEEILRDEGVFTCTRYLRPQIEAIDSNVDLVLLTIGGNDADFDNLVKQCFALGFRDAEDCEEAVDFANGVLDTLGAELSATFAQIRGRLKPEARVVLVSYPHLLLDVPYVLENDGVPYDAGAAVRALNDRGDQAQQAAVDAANAAAPGGPFIVYFDNSKPLFDTHEPNPSVLARNPERWINEFFEGEEGETAEWYHPNPLGHENWGSALSILDTFGAVGGNFEAAANIDLVFVVDTTGSMGDEIAEVRSNLSALVGQLAAATSSYRVAVVSYRDFPERTSSIDYPFRVDQTFTDSLGAIQAAIDSLEADGGGDSAETVFSGIKAAINLPWRPGVTKISVVIGDAPPLIDGSGAEPISGLTAPQIVADSVAVDPVQVVGVNVGSLVNVELQSIVDDTGGTILDGVGGLTDTLSEIIDSASKQPFAWFGSAVVGTIGVPLIFDAQGSFDPQGLPLLLFEWDFDGDGIFDLETTEETASWTYDAAFEGFVILRVTSEGGSALGSARTVVNEAGSVSQGSEEPCELDENGFSIFVGEDGSFLNCKADSLPTADKPGVREITGTQSKSSKSSKTKGKKGRPKGTKRSKGMKHRRMLDL